MIKIDNLMFSYSKKKALFDNLNLEIDGGGIVGLLGLNGAGKTTLIKLLCGFMFPKSGTIDILGFTPSKRYADFYANIYYIPDELNLPSLSGLKFVELYKPFYKDFDQAKFDRLVQNFEIDVTAKLSRMSLGQKKKFIVSFALATNSRIMFFDEPTNGLVIPAKKYFKKAIVSETTEQQLILISTHQVADINNIIDRVVILDDGRVVLNKTLWDITQQYAFVTTDSPQGAGAIYAEEAAGGYRAVVPANGQQTEVDLELLFSALTNPQKR